MGMYSKELKILDQNTVRYMIKQMQKEIDSQKEEIEQRNKQLEERDKQIEQRKNYKGYAICLQRKNKELPCKLPRFGNWEKIFARGGRSSCEGRSPLAHPTGPR